MNVELFAHDVELSPHKRRRLQAWVESAIPGEDMRVDHLEIRLLKPGAHLYACTMDAAVVAGDRIHVEAEDPDMKEAVRHATERLRRSLQRHQERRRSIRQRAQHQEANR